MHCFGTDPSLTGTAVSYDEVAWLIATQAPIGKSVTDRCQRYNILTENVLLGMYHWCDYYNSPVIAIEGYAVAAQGRAVHSLVEYGWALRSRLLDTYDAPTLLEITPTQLKKFATGKGNCPKSVVIKEVYKRWGKDFDDDNLADAFVLAEIARCYDEPERCQNAIQRTIISDVRAYHAASV